MKSPIYWCFVIALSGCAVSLYYGEILMIEPCRMCWYQRVALFPLALVLGVGFVRGGKSFIAYALPLAIFGFAVAVIQALGIHFPSLQICSREWAKAIFSMLGFITFPDLSAIGFGLLPSSFSRILLETEVKNMAKLYFRYGTMGSSKTLNLLAVAHNYRQQGKKVLLMKPGLDDRFGKDRIKSRAGLEMQADILIEDERSLAKSITLESTAFLSMKRSSYLQR